MSWNTATWPKVSSTQFGKIKKWARLPIRHKFDASLHCFLSYWHKDAKLELASSKQIIRNCALVTGMFSSTSSSMSTFICGLDSVECVDIVFKLNIVKRKFNHFFRRIRTANLSLQNDNNSHDLDKSILKFIMGPREKSIYPSNAPWGRSSMHRIRFWNSWKK